MNFCGVTALLPRVKALGCLDIRALDITLTPYPGDDQGEGLVSWNFVSVESTLCEL